MKIFEFLLKVKLKLTKRQFLVLSSIAIGFVVGTAAVILKIAVHSMHSLISRSEFSHRIFFLALFPTVGFLLTTLFVKVFLKGKLGRGLSHILYSIAKKSSFVETDKTYSHMVTSALTIGLGGSAGLESPIAITGAAIGSVWGRLFRVGYQERTLMLACGAAAGIAAVFNAPIAGVLFSVETLLVEVSISAFAPLLISAAVGALMSQIVLNESILFTFNLKQPFNYHNLPYYVILGVLLGFVSIYYSRTFHAIEGYFQRFGGMTFKKALIAGGILGVLVVLFPPLFGEGYDSVKILAGGDPALLIRQGILHGMSDNALFVFLSVAAIGLLKVYATGITISAGNGGNFAPALFVGAYMGFFFAFLINLLNISHLPMSNFTIVGMAGVLCGVMHTPLTAIFLIAELTGGYELIIPLMIVSALSYVIVKHFEPYSLDAKKLAARGQIFTEDKDRNILTALETMQIIETNFQTVPANAMLGDLVEVVAHCRRNIFPVLDQDETLLGIIPLEDIRDIMFRTELYKTVSVIELMVKPPAIVEADADMDSVMKKFDETGAWNLPVVKDGKYFGFVSKSSIFTRYREQLIEHSVRT